MLVIFALAATVMVGMVALGIDFGVATNQHRNLQEMADHAAIAGADQLSDHPSVLEQRAARLQAFLVLRENLGWRLCAIAVCANGDPMATCYKAPGPAAPISFTADITSCQLQSPYDNYTIAIETPATGYSRPVTSGQGVTLSVKVNESIATSVGAILGSSTVATGVTSVAARQSLQHSNIALYTDSGVIFHDRVENVYGDTYFANGGITAASAGDGGLCVQASLPNAGNAIFGPGLPIPAGTSQNQTQANCQLNSTGALSTMSLALQAVTGIDVPSLAPPPGIPTCSACTAAVASFPCVNGTRTTTGAVPSTCFNPGAYSTLGSVGAGIVNNLNPGIYHIYGDTSSACYASTAQTTCTSVYFSDNTFNANFKDVRDQCWAGLFSGSCPDGFAINPRAGGVNDPQCNGTAINQISAPTAAATGATGVGTLLPLTTYYLMVTALNAMGETTPSAEISVPLGVGQNTINVTITPVIGATSYQVYGPVTRSGGEVVYGAPGIATQTLTAVPTAGAVPPAFNTTGCAAGFRNIPTRPTENYGVTFVLEGKAGFDAANGKTIMFSPYCSASSCPSATSGANLNDGAFPVYAPNMYGTLDAGNGGQWAMTGTAFMPHAFLKAVGITFSLVPGQAFVGHAEFQSNNGNAPLIYWTEGVGGFVPSGVRLLK